MSGDLNIESKENGRCGIYVYGSAAFSGGGKVTIKSCKRGIDAVYAVEFSGGDVEITTTDEYGIYEHNSNVTFSGSGAVTINSGKSAVYLCDSRYALILSGTGSPISLTAGDGESAVAYYSGDGDLVTNSSGYGIESGAPDQWSVVYSYVPYGIKVNDKNVTAGNAADVLGNGKVSYDKDNNKLSIGAFSGNLTIEGNGDVDVEINGDGAAAVAGNLTPPQRTLRSNQPPPAAP